MKISQEQEEPFDGHVQSVIFQSLEGHMLADPEYVCTVVPKNLFEVVEPHHAHLSASLHQAHSLL